MNEIKTYLKKLRTKIRHLLIGHLSYEHLHIEKELEQIKLAIGKHEARQIKNFTARSIQEAEFKVFSQFGEDGIIQYLINKIPIKNKIFVELGVGNYVESNTRFLLMNNNWQGKIVNYGNEHIDFLKSENGKDIYYSYNIEAASDFIHKDNVNKIINNFNLPKDIGLLSIDLDGVDYWIWKAIEVISPQIVIIEYNSHFGADFAITVPYKQKFYRTKEHYSNLYFGSSLSALCILAKEKGYEFVGSNSAGVNAFFVRKDSLGKLSKLNPKNGHVKNMYRESKDRLGNLTFISDHKERLKLIAKLPVFEIKKNQLSTIGEVFSL